MASKFKSFLNKDNFDYSQGLINPYEFHKYFHYFSKAFLVLDDEPIPKVNYVIHTLMICDTIFSMFLSILAIYGGYKNSYLIQLVQGGTYFILFGYTLIILLCQKLNMPCYHNFLKALRKDFHFVCTEGQKYRSRFMESQLVTWKLCILSFFFVVAAIFLMLCSFLLLGVYLMTDHDPKNDPGRPLLLPIWFFDNDISSTPYYEFFFTYANITIMMIGYVYCYMTQTEVVWVRQITAQADLMIYAIEDLMDGIHPTNDPQERALFDAVLKARFRDIIKRHHEMLSLLQNFAGVYKKLMMFEQKMGGPVICLTLYATTESFLNNGEIEPILIMLSIATFNVCVVPSYMCTFLGEKIRSIHQACWNIPFWNASPVVRPYLILIMQRCLRPLPLQAPGFEDVSLQTFSNKMAGAYSMFNMLRQTNLAETFGN